MYDSFPKAEAFQTVRERALKGMCKCIKTSEHNDSDTTKSFFSIPNTDSSFLEDRITKRNSIATSTTVGDVPLPLPASDIDRVCQSSSNGEEDSLGEAMEELRDYVHEVSHAFVGRWDELLGGDKMLLQTDDDDYKAYGSIKCIINDATHLEHFHVYDSTASLLSHDSTFHAKDNEMTLSTHVDAGLFLTFVPAVSCSGDGGEDKEDDDSSFWVQVDGELRRAVFPSFDRSVVIMLGVGAQHWLRKGMGKEEWRATKHAVKMSSGAIRSWYGMMHLVPERAIIQESQSQKFTFADMRQSMVLQNQHYTFSATTNNPSEDVAIGCGSISLPASSNNTRNDISSILLPQRRRRLQMVPDPSHCNNSTNFYCWMSCLDIPDASNAELHLENGESLYCTDSAENIESGVENCEDPYVGIPGSAMNFDCIGVWHATAFGVPHQYLNISTAPGGGGISDGTDGGIHGRS
jgi:hypothetical protein